MPPPSLYVYDAAKKQIAVETLGANAGRGFSLQAPGGGRFHDHGGLWRRAEYRQQHHAETGRSAADKSFVRLVYPFVPFKGGIRDEIVLEKVVDGAVVARAAVPVNNDEKLMNTFGSLRLSVRKDGLRRGATRPRSRRWRTRAASRWLWRRPR